jgi:hypothetical protein
MTQAIFLAIASVLLSSAAQLILKYGMLKVVRGTASHSTGMPQAILSALGSPIVWSGLVVYGASAVVWLGVLSRLYLSLVYLMVAMGIVITYLVGIFVFHEPILKCFGVTLIVAGVLIVGMGGWVLETFSSVATRDGIRRNQGRRKCLARQRVRRAAVEVKYEEVYLHAYDSVAAAKAGIQRYFAFYNGRRPHTALDRNTPDNVYFNSQPLAAAA